MAELDVLLATYQGAPHLAALLKSLEAQTYADWRLILRDDGSTDDSTAIVEEWAIRSGKSLKVLRDDGAGLGPAASFGRLLVASDAPYFCFCDQDDVWLPEKLEQLVDAVKKAESVSPERFPVLAHCDLRVIDEKLDEISPSFWAMNYVSDGSIARVGRPATVPASLLLQNTVTGCSLLGNAALRRSAIPIPSDVGMHDWWLALVAAYLGEIKGVASPLVLYRQHGSNVIGARGWGPLSVLQRGLKGPLGALRRAHQSLQASQAMAIALANRHEASIRREEFRVLKAYSELRNRRVLARKLFLFRYGIRPAAWIILPIFLAVI